jgi:hypothetical protein
VIYPEETIVDLALEYFDQFPIRCTPRHAAYHELNTLAALDGEKLKKSTKAYSLPDEFHPHRFAVPVQRRKTPRMTAIQAFKSESFLRAAITKSLRYSNRAPVGWFSELGLVHGVQVASNFRPGFAAYCYRRFAGDKAFVIDPCAGFGGRLLGAVAARNVEPYLGIDAAQLTVWGNQELARRYARTGGVDTTFCHAAVEDMGTQPLMGRDADYILTCPPYWRKEHYSNEDTQSWVRYQTFDEWVLGFLAPLAERCYAWLKPGGVCTIVVADVNIAYERRPVAAATRIEMDKAGFRFLEQESYALPKRFGRGEAPDSHEIAAHFVKEVK